MTKDYVINNKELMEEWNWEKNNSLGLFPSKLTFGSNKKAWWKCKNGHDWFAPVYKKVERKNCPFCSNRRILSGYNDIQTLYPELMEEWDWDANRNINPNTLSKNSIKNVYWICKKCGFKWMTAIRNRTIRNAGCHQCSLINRGKSKHKSALLKTGSIDNHECICDWNYEKNKRLPSDYSIGSNEYVFWKCHICGYKWRGKVANRTILKRGCPCCSNKIIVEGVNDLKTLRPDITKEWDFSKNEITPDKVSVGSGKKVWWICPNGHEYQATVLHRTYGIGTSCPICNSGRGTSFAEQCVYYYVKQLYPDAINRYKDKWLKNMELDIFIPSINYAIEYDGAAWHKKNNITREQRKYKLCHEHNVKLIRIREEFSPLGSCIADYEFGDNKELYKPKNLKLLIERLLKFLNFSGLANTIKVDIYKDRNEILDNINKNPKISFASKFPSIAKEWYYKLNGNLKPEMFSPYSDHKVWWKCPKCKNIYESIIGHRAHGTGCPKCGIEKSKLSKCKKVLMLDIKTGATIREFISISDAARKMNINGSNISMVCLGKRQAAGGYHWKFVDIKKD